MLRLDNCLKICRFSSVISVTVSKTVTASRTVASKGTAAGTVGCAGYRMWRWTGTSVSTSAGSIATGTSTGCTVIEEFDVPVLHILPVFGHGFLCIRFTEKKKQDCNFLSIARDNFEQKLEKSNCAFRIQGTFLLTSET